MTIKNKRKEKLKVDSLANDLSIIKSNCIRHFESLPSDKTTAIEFC